MLALGGAYVTMVNGDRGDIQEFKLCAQIYWDILQGHSTGSAGTRDLGNFSLSNIMSS